MEPSVFDDLSGQVALVTGATRGIGAQVASNLADRGATVYAGARDVADVDDERLRPLELDVTRDDQIRAAFDDIDRLDVLVNNAAVTGPKGALDAASLDDVDACLDVNLRGPIAVTKQAVPALLDRDGARVVNVSSGMGALGESMNGGWPAYRISKTGLNGLTAYLHGEYGDRGLIANAVCPGWVRTDMGGPSAARDVETGADTPTWLARFEPGATGGRFWRDRRAIPW